jgi:glycosyltransferase involved in cell wall biosynthesis
VPVPSPLIAHFGGRRFLPPRFGILSTYPPTACGLATFSTALANGLIANGADVSIVRVADGTRASSKRVIGELVNGSPESVAESSELLNQCDAAIVQHEYGLYGGADGDEVLDVLAGLRIPSIVIAHTILTNPTPHQRSTLVAVAAMADHLVVMSDAARERLCSRFDVDPAIVTTIPHGAAIPTRPAPHESGARPTILTCGLIGPGKGIERVIDAMRSLQRLPGRPRYLVAGQTHPKVLAANGEAYRHALIERAARNGVGGSVFFDATYRDVESHTALLQSATVVVLPYDSKDQVTSGVLADAIAAGRPVVATSFPHAVELLASGAGMIVDRDDPAALVSALSRVLVEPGLADRMAAEASRLAPSMCWSVVAGSYVDLANRLLSKDPALV